VINHRKIIEIICADEIYKELDNKDFCVCLYGSHARERDNKRSDIDIIIIHKQNFELNFSEIFSTKVNLQTSISMIDVESIYTSCGLFRKFYKLRYSKYLFGNRLLHDLSKRELSFAIKKSNLSNLYTMYITDKFNQNKILKDMYPYKYCKGGQVEREFYDFIQYWETLNYKNLNENCKKNATDATAINCNIENTIVELTNLEINQLINKYFSISDKALESQK